MDMFSSRLKFSCILLIAILVVFGQSNALAKTRTIKVKCAKGDSINEALMTVADELIIEISGMCEESVFINRNNVTLRGSDPLADGIQAVDEDSNAIIAQGTYGLQVENLAITGGKNGMVIGQSTGQTQLTNCWLEGNRSGAHLQNSAVRAENCRFAAQSWGVMVMNSSFLTCYDCEISSSDWAGMTVEAGSRAYLQGSDISGDEWAIIVLNSNVIVRNGSTVSATSGAIWATGGSTASINSAPLLSGSLTCSEGSSLYIGGTTQEANPNGNVVRNDSFLNVSNGSILTGQLDIVNFGKTKLDLDSTINGDMACRSGGDAYCDDANNVTGDIIGCSLCIKTQ
jgi:hypothetical protein